jgi:uncharacterized protein (TIGR02246 family)
VDEMLAFTAWTRETEARNAAFPVFERWMKAFEAADVEAMVHLYAPGATVIASGSKQVISGPAEIRTYFESTLRATGPRAAVVMYQHNNALSDDVVVVRGSFESKGTRDGTAFSELTHFTFIIARHGTAWLIAHSHVSTTAP